MPSPTESIRFDAKEDEIGVLAGSLTAFLSDQNVMLMERNVRERGTRRFKKIYSLYSVSQFDQPIDPFELMKTEPLIDIEPRKIDCLINFRPNILREDISFNKLWEQFILTRYHYSRQN
jgi:hypothetical protein